MSTVQQSISNLTTLKSDFTYKELKKQCILRGIEFEEATSSSFPHLSSWLLAHRFDDENKDSLYKYDLWIEKQLHEQGKDYLIHNSLRLSFINDGSAEPKPEETKDIKKPKKKRVKRTKNKQGLFSGTKKAYTFELTLAEKPFKTILRRVLKRFPDAREKSVKIWYNKAKKTM